MRPKRAAVRTLWILTAILSLIGVATVTRRTLTLVAPSPAPPGFPEAAAGDASFAQHAVFTMVHMIPGLLFVLLGPLQFIRTLRSRRPEVHRWLGRIFVVSGLMVGTTAFVMSPRMAIGGANEIAATMYFACLLLFALLKAFTHIRCGCVALHREWMIRAYAIGLAATTIRPIVAIFFVTRRLTHLTIHELFGTAFWLGFITHLIAAEIWINYTRPLISADRKA